MHAYRKRSAHKFGNPRILRITFHTLRHWKGTTEYHKTKDILHVKRVLGHKRIDSTMIYINLENALFKTVNEEFTARVAHDIKEACAFIEAGFAFVTGEYSDGGKSSGEENDRHLWNPPRILRTLLGFPRW